MKLSDLTLKVDISDDRFTKLMFEQKKEIERLREALAKIAHQDYRGNRCGCSQIAQQAINLKSFVEKFDGN